MSDAHGNGGGAGEGCVKGSGGLIGGGRKGGEGRERKTMKAEREGVGVWNSEVAVATLNAKGV